MAPVTGPDTSPAQMTSGPASRTWPSGAGRIFSLLWILGVLTHVWNQGSPGWLSPEPVRDAWYWLVLLAGAYALHNPASARRFVAFCSVTGLAVVAQYPFTADHWVLAGIVSLVVVTSAWRVHRLGVTLTMDAVVERAAPAARAALLVGYTGAAVAKLNTTFLHPVDSCAVDLAGRVLGFWGLSAPPPSLRVGVVVAATELAVPVLLLVRRTRGAGIALAAIFHFLMAITPSLPVMDFTGALFPLLMLFAPCAFLQAWNAIDVWTGRRLPLTRNAAGHTSTRLVLLGAMIAFVGLRGLAGTPLPNFDTTWLVLSMLGLPILWGTILVVGIWSLVRVNFRVGPLSRTNDRPAVGQAIAVMAVVILVASPYIGLGTTSSFSMFSNLRTEVGETNHIVLPRFNVFELQDEFLEVVDSSDEYLRQAAINGELVHSLEVRRRLASNPDASIVLVRDGETIEVGRAGDDPSLVEIGYWEAKLLRFRNLAADGQQPCAGR